MEAILVDSILLALCFWAGYTWGKRVAVIRIIQSIIEDPEHLGRALDQFRQVRASPEVDDMEADELVVERHGDHVYLYTKDGHEFLGQGATLGEALDRVNQRFPDRKYAGQLTREQADALGIKQ